jgi:hypothetical protein
LTNFSSVAKPDAAQRGGFPERALQLAALASGLCFALFVPVIYGAETVTALQLLAICAISTMAVLMGEAIRVALGRFSMASLNDCAGIVLGFSALSIIHLMATMGLNVGAGGALWVDAVVCIFSAWLIYHQFCDNTGLGPPAVSWKDIRSQCLLMVALGLLVTLWGREALQSVVEAKQTGVFRVWNDFLFQAAEIGYQINYPAFNGESGYLAGQPQVFYHRASYSHAALFGWISGDPLIGVATYYWLPAGILMMGLGAYALGHVLGGRFAGVASALALFLLPDASMYGLKNGYFAFYWLIHVAPGSGYAIGLCTVALAFYFAGQRQPGDLRYLQVGLAIALAGAMFRMHVAIPVMVLLAAVLVFKVQERSSVRPLVFLAALAVLGFCVMLVFESISMAPHFISGKAHGLTYIDFVHWASPTAYEGVYGRWTDGWPRGLKGVPGYLLLLVAQHGLVLPLLLVFLWRSPDTASRRPMAQVALGLLLIHAAITFLVPTPGNGDITEWSHRSFVVIHAVLTVLLVSSCAGILRQIKGDVQVGHMNWRTQMAAGFATVALVWVPWHFGKNLQYGTLKDGPSACATKISAEVFEAAQYIRAHTRPTDRFFASNADPDAVLTALTGLQAYVSRGMFFYRLGGPLRAAVEERMSEFAEAKHAATIEALVAFGAKSGVRWVVVENKDWPDLNRALLSQAVLLNRQIAIFDLKPDTPVSRQ